MNPLIYLLLMVPAAPLLLAGASVLPGVRRRLMLALPIATVPALIAALSLPDEVVVLEWLLLGARFGIDETGRVFLLFTAVLWLAAGWYANAYIEEPKRRTSYAVFHLLAMSGNLGVIVAHDMVSFFLFFALMSFASYGLVIHNRDTEAMRAGRVYLSLVVVGEVILFAGLQRLAAANGGLALPAVAASPDFVTTLLLFIGFGIKAGALPLHVWLPLAHPAAPVPASAVLSGAMIKAGLIGWLRFLPLGHPEAVMWAGPVISIGLCAAFLGAVVGFCQTNAKAVLAYSSISQMGLMTAGVGLCFRPGQELDATIAIIALFAAHHALCKGTLFLSVGIMAHPPKLPRELCYVAVLLPALALVGAPFTSGALAKGMLKVAGNAVGGWSILLPLTGVGTTLLMLRFLRLARQMSPGGHHHAPAAPGQWLPWLLLTGLVVVFPMLPFAAGPIAPQPGWWSKLWPILSGVVIAFALIPRLSSKLPLVPPGDILVCFVGTFRMLKLLLDSAGRSLRPAWVGIRWSARGCRRHMSGLWNPASMDLRRPWSVSAGLLLLFIIACVVLMRV